MHVLTFVHLRISNSFLKKWNYVSKQFKQELELKSTCLLLVPLVMKIRLLHVSGQPIAACCCLISVVVVNEIIGRLSGQNRIAYDCVMLILHPVIIGGINVFERYKEWTPKEKGYAIKYVRTYVT